MLIRMVPIVAAAALLLCGCQETASKTAKDVAVATGIAEQNDDEARNDASEAVATANDMVADAQKAYANTDEAALDKLNTVEADAIGVTAGADFDVATVEAQGRYDIAEQKCDALVGVDKIACLDRAEVALAADNAAATATRDAALADAGRQR